MGPMTMRNQNATLQRTGSFWPPGWLFRQSCLCWDAPLPRRAAQRRFSSEKKERASPEENRCLRWVAHWYHIEDSGEEAMVKEKGKPWQLHWARRSVCRGCCRRFAASLPHPGSPISLNHTSSSPRVLRSLCHPEMSLSLVESVPGRLLSIAAVSCCCQEAQAGQTNWERMGWGE